VHGDAEASSCVKEGPALSRPARPVSFLSTGVGAEPAGSSPPAASRSPQSEEFEGGDSGSAPGLDGPPIKD
jgi:hypothetical protein